MGGQLQRTIVCPALYLHDDKEKKQNPNTYHNINNKCLFAADFAHWYLQISGLKLYIVPADSAVLADIDAFCGIAFGSVLTILATEVGQTGALKLTVKNVYTLLNIWL